MATDLTKMVEDWYADQPIPELGIYSLTQILKAMAAEIEGNREEIERLKTGVIPVGTVKPDDENIRSLKVERSK